MATHWLYLPQSRDYCSPRADGAARFDIFRGTFLPAAFHRYLQTMVPTQYDTRTSSPAYTSLLYRYLRERLPATIPPLYLAARVCAFALTDGSADALWEHLSSAFFERYALAASARTYAAA